MQKPSAARRLFHLLIRRPDQRVPLAEAALAIAWEDQGGSDPRPALAALERFAAEARPHVATGAGPHEQMAGLNHYLFVDQRFYGDPHCYRHPDPANSYLDQVFARRTGLPIMLAVVYMEVGWRLGLPLSGLALPGHFIVRWSAPGGDLFLDPFSGGTLWSMGDCQRQIARFYGRPAPDLIEWVMRPPARGAILARILRNLKQTHLARDDVRLALAAVERLLLLDQSDSAELRDRGLLRFRTGATYAALADLEAYARRSPDAADLPQIRAFARELLAGITPRN